MVNGPPEARMPFQSRKAVFSFVELYAESQGFSVVKYKFTERSIALRCSEFRPKKSKKAAAEDSSANRGRPTHTKCGCNSWKVNANIQADGTWKISDSICLEHENHTPTPLKVDKQKLEALQSATQPALVRPVTMQDMPLVELRRPPPCP
ncbi:FAR1 DNA-binding domain [Carpediemonas membranifera]|uniref:FAR1 DNA-binding domain n=1 Tax=Carpediemonas membranifera TaxID=201153 RepID=A0A8J6E5S5_9EUKA|nr:FAR1 DNA-binding domain [Carpediemonas membranifera]|eukprot:KAG9396232.1 FAR1 DNA-binding domain [Carpediemonas membranifera]